MQKKDQTTQELFSVITESTTNAYMAGLLDGYRILKISALHSSNP